MTLEHDKVYSPTDVQELLKIDSSPLRNAPFYWGPANKRVIPSLWLLITARKHSAGTMKTINTPL